MKKAKTSGMVFEPRWLGFTALSLVVAGMLVAAGRANASSPTGHIIISEQVMKKIMNDPNANPELKAILSDPNARKAFSGGACAPDLDSISDKAHSEDPKATADKIMAAARAKLAKAEAALKAAGTPQQKANAEKVINQAKCDIAFAYGWRCHAAADFETHPYVNASGENYWEDSTKKDKVWHGEWETMQEANWINKYGPPNDPNVDYRLGLLEDAFGLDHNKLLGDVQTLSYKETGAATVGSKYTQGQLDDWSKINDGLGDKCIDRGIDFTKNSTNPLDDSCWDIAIGIPVDDFKKFVEDTKKANGGKLPDGFWVNYDTLYNKWKHPTGTAGTPGGTGTTASSGGTGTTGTSGSTGTPGTGLPGPTTTGQGGQSGQGTQSGKGTPKLDKFR